MVHRFIFPPESVKLIFIKKLNRMDDISDSLRSTILEENVTVLLANRIHPTALSNGFVAVDINVTPMDNSKPTMI